MSGAPRGSMRLARCFATGLLAGWVVAPGTALPATLLADTPLQDLNATRDRPLFQPSRRAPSLAPPPAPVAAPARPERVEESPGFTLLGVVRTPDRGGTAVLMDEAARTTFSLKPGDSRGGWVMRTLDADAVTLAKGPRTVRLGYPKGASAPRLPAN